MDIIQESAVKLTNNELKLFQSIRKIAWNSKLKNDLIEEFIQQVEGLPRIRSGRKGKKWLQVGDKNFFQSLNPVKPAVGSPLASDIISKQRDHFSGKYA